MACIVTSKFLAKRARRGSRATFERVLAKVRDVPPLPGDELDKVRAARKGSRSLQGGEPSGRPLAKGAPRSRSRS